LINPFKAVGDHAQGMFRAADGCDFFDHTALKVMACPIIAVAAPFVFVGAFFRNKEAS
jgi:hypothetical protein